MGPGQRGRASSKIYTLHPTVHGNTCRVRFERVVYPLKMGPVQGSMTAIERETSFDTSRSWDEYLRWNSRKSFFVFWFHHVQLNEPDTVGQ